MATPTTTCGESLIALLQQRDVEVVFGIPGVHTLEMYRGLKSSLIRHITPRHEQGAAYMADAYARVSRRPGVCLLITGAGLTNAATAVANAYHDSQPLLILSSATDSRDAGRGRGALHDLPNQQGLMATLTGSSETVRRAADLEAALERAFTVLEGPRPRPAYIGIPIDVLAQPAPPDIAPARSLSPAIMRPSKPSPRALEVASDLLAQAQSPMILLGGGAIDAGSEALKIAEACGASIVTTINGKGTVPETHPVALGATLNLEPVFGALECADVVLAVGTELSEVDYYYQSRIPEFTGALIRIDSDPAQVVSGRPPTVAIIGEARATLAELAARLQSMTVDRAGCVPSEEAARRAGDLRSRLKWWPRADSFFPILDAIGHALPLNTIITADSTQLAYVANSYLTVERPRSYIAPAGFGTLGPALPMAIGAKIAAPQRPVVCLIGDGGLLFTIAELATAATNQIPIVVLLWNNDGYGEIRDAMDGASIPHIGTDGSARDYLKIAHGLGCGAARLDAIDQVGPAITEALRNVYPTVLELPAQLAQ